MDPIKMAYLGNLDAQIETSKKNELLACPCCFGPPKVIYTGDKMKGKIKIGYVECQKCKMRTVETVVNVAILAWNMRPKILTDDELELLK